MNVDLKGSLTVTRLLKNASVAASANSTAVDMSGYITQFDVVVDIGDSSAGSSPTLDIKIQSGAVSDGSDAADITGAAITQATAATTQTLRVDPRAMTGKYLRVVKTIGGTSSPAFPCSVVAIGRKQVQP